MPVDLTKLNQVTRDKWGRDITYTPQGGSPRTIRAVQNFDYYDDTGATGIQTVKAAYDLVSKDVPELAVGDGINDGTAYTIRVLVPDYDGVVTVILQKD